MQHTGDFGCEEMPTRQLLAWLMNVVVREYMSVERQVGPRSSCNVVELAEQ